MNLVRKLFRPKLAIQIIPGAEDIQLINYAHRGDAGMDLRANVPEETPIGIPPGQTALVKVGFKMAIPEGYEAQIRPRSGLALKNGITVLNSPGTIDSGYRDEVGVILHNFGKDVFYVHRGDRIAQMVIARCEQPLLEVVVELSKSARGLGGFGSSGVK